MVRSNLEFLVDALSDKIGVGCAHRVEERFKVKFYEKHKDMAFDDYFKYSAYQQQCFKNYIRAYYKVDAKQ